MTTLLWIILGMWVLGLYLGVGFGLVMIIDTKIERVDHFGIGCLIAALWPIIGGICLGFTVIAYICIWLKGERP